MHGDVSGKFQKVRMFERKMKEWDADSGLWREGLLYPSELHEILERVLRHASPLH